VDIPKDLYYTKDHEWVHYEGQVVTIGITDFAQGELGDVIFLELPDVGQDLIKDDPFGTIEAVKTVADLYAPIDGNVLETNADLEDAPELINQDPYGKGWMIKIEVDDDSGKNNLMSPEEYEASLD
jgi:glycine cleavage system H protein